MLELLALVLVCLNARNIVAYLDPRSTCSRSVLLTAAIMGFEESSEIDYRISVVDLGLREQKTDEHLRRHPFGKVPAILVDKETYIYETNAIINFFQSIKPEIELVPKEPLKVAKMNQLISVYSGYFAPAYHGVYWELVLKERYNKGEPDMELVAESLRKTASVVQIIAQDFEGGRDGYWLGDKITLADIRFFPGFVALDDAGKLMALIERHRSLRRWYHRMLGSEEWKSVYSYTEKMVSGKRSDDNTDCSSGGEEANCKAEL